MKPLKALISKKTIHKAHVPDPNNCLKSDLMPFDIVCFNHYGFQTAMYLTARDAKDFISLNSAQYLFPDGIFLTCDGDIVGLNHFDNHLNSKDYNEYSDIQMVIKYDEKIFGTIKDEQSIYMVLQSPFLDEMIRKGYLR